MRSHHCSNFHVKIKRKKQNMTFQVKLLEINNDFGTFSHNNVSSPNFVFPMCLSWSVFNDLSVHAELWVKKPQSLKEHFIIRKGSLTVLIVSWNSELNFEVFFDTWDMSRWESQVWKICYFQKGKLPFQRSIFSNVRLLSSFETSLWCVFIKP